MQAICSENHAHSPSHIKSDVETTDVMAAQAARLRAVNESISAEEDAAFVFEQTFFFDAYK